MNPRPCVHLIVLAVCAAFFLSLFAQFPLHGRLPGNSDTWYAIAFTNMYLNQVRETLGLGSYGTFFYPVERPLSYGETSIALAIVPMLLRSIGFDDVTTYYLFISLIYASTAFATYLLARFYVADPAVAAFAGLAFAACNYTLGNIDSPHTSFFFIAFVCLYYCKRYLSSGKRRDLLLAALLGGLQVYFSAYVFLFQSAAAAALLGLNLLRRRQRQRADVRTLALAGLIFLAVAAPFFGFYAMTLSSTHFTNPWDLTFLAELHSLEPSDLLRTLENNVLYPFDRPIVADDISHVTQRMLDSDVVRMESLTSEDSTLVLGTLSTPDDVKYFVYTRRCAFLGFVLYALAAVGLASGRRFRWELVSLYLAALIISFGPVISIGDSIVPNLTLPAYKWVEVARVLRVPSRAFSFSVLAVVLAAAAGLQRVVNAPALRAKRWRFVVIGVLFLAVLAENVPFPLKAFAGERLARPESIVQEFFGGRSGDVLLDLPSQPGGALYRDSEDLFEWNRELIYMNRATYHRQSIVNGVHGYFPRSRLQVQRLVNDLPARGSFTGLRELGVDYIVYHRTLELPWEAGLYEKLVGSERLKPVAAGPEATIFGLPSPNPVDSYIEEANAFLASTQGPGGSWPGLRSTMADLSSPALDSGRVGTMMTLLNLTGTNFEYSLAFERGAEFLRRRMNDGFRWSSFEPGRFGEDPASSPDALATALALTVMSDHIEIPEGSLAGLRERLDGQRTADGLYLTYFEGADFDPHADVPSVGVNLCLLGFFGEHGLERSGLLEALRILMQRERYWEADPFYGSLAVLAYFASNAVEHGVPEAEALLRRLLEDFVEAAGGTISPAAYDNVELAAFVKARSHLCLLERAPCRDVDAAVAELSRRRQPDDSWNPAPLRRYAIAHGTYHEASAAETTSMVLKALVFYREVLDRRSRS